jgi:paraquat-inducible protein A
MSASSALSRGLWACAVCGTLRLRPNPLTGPRCARCGSPLSPRKPQSLQRTVALALSAALLYVPANLLPIMRTTTLGYDHADTIVGGVVVLWESGSWPLAMLVFVVSVLVPCLKLLVLGLLVACTQRRSSWRLHERARLYRLIEFIGRWSMLDVFVVALLVGLVQLRGIATIHAEAGAFAFAAVVVLTMYATRSFDPRLMWDVVAPSPRHPHG